MEDPYGLSGKLLERRYRVDAPLAEGGFAIVYRGHHLSLDVPVALKVLRPIADPGAAADLVARFMDEAKTVARLRHPNIVGILDTGVLARAEGPLPWMALEWLDGETLHAHLESRRGAPLSLAETMRVVLPLLDALALAHERGIAHRDVKPRNVMLSRGTAQLLDFGIAKLLRGDEVAGSGTTRTHGGSTSLSLGYASPEQVAGARSGPWTDVHAMGLVLTEMLTGRPPYGSEAHDIWAKAVDPVRPTPARAGVDVGPLEPIIARALSLRPKDRWPSARELALALAPFA